MSDKTGTTRTLTINQQKLEKWIEDQEDAGEFLNAMGVLSDEELAAGIHQLEDFRVKVELDPAYADQKETALENGEVPVQL